MHCKLYDTNVSVLPKYFPLFLNCPMFCLVTSSLFFNCKMSCVIFLLITYYKSAPLSFFIVYVISLLFFYFSFRSFKNGAGSTCDYCSQKTWCHFLGNKFYYFLYKHRMTMKTKSHFLIFLAIFLLLVKI